MSKIAGLMRVLQFGDSMLPVGAFSFSNGLESAVQAGLVHDSDSLRQFVLTATEQAATGDGIAILIAFRAAQVHNLRGVIEADHASYIRKLNEETRTMTTRMGRKFGELATSVIGNHLIQDWVSQIKLAKTPGTYPVAQALVFSALGLSEQEAFAVHQYGITSMMLGAALRLMKITHIETQKLLYEINCASEAAYHQVKSAALDEMHTFAPVLDVMAAIHLQSKVRMFMN